MKKFMAVLAVLALVAFAAPAFAATNPFMDVPAGHWAYDAVAQLASRGVASGYPDGSYKGTQPATRYEMGSMVARILARVDMEKASKQDVELLKRLVLEFKNELDALGVKVNDLDKRVSVLEEGLGGWKIRGIFNFEANFGDSDTGVYMNSNNRKRNEFDKERFRLFLTKQINENTFFYAQYRTGSESAGNEDGRGDLQHMRWADLYVDTKLPWDIGLRAGRFLVDFEKDYGFYTDKSGTFGDFRTDGFRLKKSLGMLDTTAIVGRNSGVFDSTTAVDGYDSEGDYTAYILDLHLRPNEKFFVGATGFWGIEDSTRTTAAGNDWDFSTYAFYAGYSFTQSIALKGIYYFQDLGDSVVGANLEDGPTAWKAVLEIKQEALKFTSLWLEYLNMDNTFRTGTHPMYSFGGATSANVMHNQPLNNETTQVLFARAGQQWTDKWGSWLRFAWADFDTNGLDDTYEYGVGVTYQMNPAIQFELAYSLIDYGTNNAAGFASKHDNTLINDKESVIRFRTSVNF